MSVIDIDQVQIIRGQTTILDGVTWKVAEGEHWALLGPNGAGKTTLVSLLTGNIFPSSGTAKILGETLGQTNVAQLRSRVGLASAAQLAQIPPQTEILSFVLTGAYGTAALAGQEFENLDRERARNLAEIFNIERLRGRQFGTLSDGERQRAMIARSLMPDPELLVLDEPSAGLDMGAREELLGALSELAADASSPNMVLVTHHIEEIPAGFTHALVLQEGRVAAAGPVQQTLSAQVLSQAFALPLTVQSEDGRYWARTKR
ncbi:MAG: ATP-binding cassette domain-containing protein [Actinomycetaceae bacterium]|nr:ATP-binding cassette domain-containing protein [Actinomycetaceae bacterium]